MSPKVKDALRQYWPLIWLAPFGIIMVASAVLIAITIRETPLVQDFMTTYPGQTELPESAPVGFPAWLGWTHFLNGLMLLLIIRSGWMVRTVQRPEAYWTRNPAIPFRTRNSPKKISLDLWFHISIDVLWVINGVVFFVLLFLTGQWMRIVPTSWEVFPNALSTAIQYASLSWPTDNGWVNYNSLQVLAYFVTVFIATPLAIITGVRMSPLWPRDAGRLNKAYPIEWARAIHFPVMLYFVLFIIVHVALVFATGILRNLNHMYAMRDDESWWGLWIFAASVVVMIGAWLAARPIILRPIAQLTGKVTKN